MQSSRLLLMNAHLVSMQFDLVPVSCTNAGKFLTPGQALSSNVAALGQQHGLEVQKSHRPLACRRHQTQGHAQRT